MLIFLQIFTWKPDSWSLKYNFFFLETKRIVNDILDSSEKVIKFNCFLYQHSSFYDIFLYITFLYSGNRKYHLALGS